MKSDITPPKTSILGRFNPKDHDHRWHFLQTRMVFEPVNPGNSDLHKQVEYAYFVCNDCPETDDLPNIIKREVKVSNARD